MSNIKCLKYHAINKGFIVGSADVLVVKWGLIISDIKIFSKDNKSWINLPSKMVETNGEKKFFPYIRFERKEDIDKFKDAVLESVKEFQVVPFPDMYSKFVEEDLPF